MNQSIKNSVSNVLKFTGIVFMYVIFPAQLISCKDGPGQEIGGEVTVVSEMKNLEHNGAAFGRHTNKIARFDSTIFTFIMPNDPINKHIILCKKQDGKSWTTGVQIPISRPPDLLIDSKGHVHLIGHRLFNSSNQHDGRLFHIVFLNAMDIQGEYRFEFITPDWRDDLRPETYATYYSGATIDAENQITVVYCNSWYNSQLHSLGSVCFSSDQQSWEYAAVDDSLISRLCYPYVVQGARRTHVVTVEDHYDAELESTGYPYRYGKVVYHWKERGKEKVESWHSQTLINLNEQLAVSEIPGRVLRVSDVFYDTNDTLHVLLKMNVPLTLIRLNLIPETKLIYLKKHEQDAKWIRTELPFSKYHKPRIWQCVNGAIVMVSRSGFVGRLEIISLSSMQQIATGKTARFFGNPYTFIPSNRGTARHGNRVLDMVFYDAMFTTTSSVHSIFHLPCTN